MAIQVKLDSIIEGLESQSFESCCFLDIKTGEIALVSDYEMQVAEDNEPIDDLPDWQEGCIQTAKEIIREAGSYIQLPTKFDVDEYSIIEDFCYSLGDEDMRDELLNLITGSGAFRRFKDAVEEYGISDKWHEHRNSEFRQIAIDWCKENCIEFR